MIHYVNSLNGIAAGQLRGVFEGWPKPPSPQTHLRLLSSSDEIVLAIDDSSRDVVGFITAITDGVLAAYIPLLEVVPAYRGRVIGRELVLRMLKRLERFYMVDLLCDSSLESFYSELGMTPSTGMMIRR
ncbi:MAG TPA: GNAT family N-acetyltransferase, partial [bacterium]|nr:GNAT family N-acetyltransferase [bacterium]